MNYQVTCSSSEQQAKKNSQTQNKTAMDWYSGNEFENFSEIERKNFHDYPSSNRQQSRFICIVSKAVSCQFNMAIDINQQRFKLQYFQQKQFQLQKYSFGYKQIDLPSCQKEQYQQNFFKKQIAIKQNELNSQEQEEENYIPRARLFKLPLMETNINNRSYGFSQKFPKFSKKDKDLQLQTLSERRQSIQDAQQITDPLNRVINSNKIIYKVILGKQNFEKIKSLERQGSIKYQDHKMIRQQENKKLINSQFLNQEIPNNIIRFQQSNNNSSPSKVFFMQNPAQISLQQLTNNSSADKQNAFKNLKKFQQGQQSYSPQRNGLNNSENCIKGIKIINQNTNIFLKSQNSKNLKFQNHIRSPNNHELPENQDNQILKKQSASMNQSELLASQQSMNQLFLDQQIKNFHSTAKTKFRNQNNFKRETNSNQLFLKKKQLFQEIVDKYNSQNLIQKIPSKSIFEETYIKAFVGPGNNSSLIKYVSGQRWWFEVYDMNDKANPSIFSADSSVYSDKIYKEVKDQQVSRYQGELIWTQIKQNEIIIDMPTLKEFKQEKNEQKQTKQQKIEPEQQTDTTCQTLEQKCLSSAETNENSGQKKDSEQLQKQMDRQILKLSNTPSIRIYNHFEYNFQICNKKNMYLNLKEFYEKRGEKLLFKRIPYTFHVKKASMKDSAFAQFCKYYNKIQNGILAQQKKNSEKYCKNIWIVKPAENTNRGTGIFVSREIAEIKQFISQNTSTLPNQNNSATNYRNSPKQKNKQIKHTYIIQKYIENPLLYQKRKIDIRCYILLTNYNGIIKAYWYKEGYIRTSSKEFTTKNLKNNFIHLTNDAIQKQQDDYGRYEQGNKISYKEFQRYLDSQTEYKINFMQNIVPQMKSYALDCVRSIFTKIDPNRRQFCFELFGLDYMIDDDLKVWLIEVNANPCLEQSCPLLTKIIPPLIHNTLKITVDPLSQGVNIDNWNIDKIEHFSRYYQNETDKFECIFDELKDGEDIYKLYQN